MGGVESVELDDNALEVALQSLREMGIYHLVSPSLLDYYSQTYNFPTKDS